MKDRLREIIISITNRCNLRCAMCEIPQLGYNEEMATEELKSIICDAVKFNASSIVFSGGEPLLRNDIFELISFTNRLKINTCLASNGTLVSREIARRLYFSKIGVVNISIEGPEEVHDSLRGTGSFKKAIGALENLVHYKIETTIATIMCKRNYRYAPFVMKLAHQFKVNTVKFQPFSEIFLSSKEKRNDFLISLDYLKEILQDIEKVIELSKRYKISTNPIDYLHSIPIYLSGLERTHSLSKSCNAIWNSCPISAEGNVYLCWIFSDRILGNIKKDRLSNIWNSKEHNQLRQSFIKDNCYGCLMSCYDYNFGKDNLKETLSIKINKFNSAKFYKRLYFRFYQSSRYVLKKIINQITSLYIFKRRKKSVTFSKLREIKLAKDLLKSQLITTNNK